MRIKRWITMFSFLPIKSITSPHLSELAFAGCITSVSLLRINGDMLAPMASICSDLPRAKISVLNFSRGRAVEGKEF